MNNIADIKDPVLYWLNMRSKYVLGAENWEWVSRDPIVSRLAPVLYILDREDNMSLHEKTRHELAQLYWNNVARWMVNENHLKKVLNAFSQEGMTVIPLKGAALHSRLYKNIGLRFMSDIDILVPIENFLSAINIMCQCGFKVCTKDNSKNLASLEKFPKKYWPNELSFCDQQGLGIDLHQNLMNVWMQPSFPLNVDAIWERSISVSRDGPLHEEDEDGLWKNFLSPYDTLAYLCLHLALHGLQFPQTYLDIDLSIRSLPDTWDWGQFLDLVNEWRIRSATYHTFLICRRFMGTPLPDGLLKRLDPGWLARSRVKILISSRSILADRPSLGKRYPTLVKLALIDRLPSIMVTLCKLVFPDNTWREHNPFGRSLLGHWSHIFNVIKRGD